VEDSISKFVISNPTLSQDEIKYITNSMKAECLYDIMKDPGKKRNYDFLTV
jgi:hypothetical protein